MPKAARLVMAALEKKGFQKRENDHTFFHLYVGGKKTIVFTKVSHGEKEIPDKLLGVMARQLKIKKKQFLDLIDCPLTEEKYLEILRQAGIVEKPKEPPG